MADDAGAYGFSVFQSAALCLNDWTRELDQLHHHITGGRLQDKLMLEQMNVGDYFMTVDSFLSIKEKEREAVEKARASANF